MRDIFFSMHKTVIMRLKWKKRRKSTSKIQINNKIKMFSSISFLNQINNNNTLTLTVNHKGFRFIFFNNNRINNSNSNNREDNNSNNKIHKKFSRILIKYSNNLTKCLICLICKCLVCLICLICQI